MFRRICLFFLCIIFFHVCQKREPVKVKEFKKIAFISNREATANRQHIFMMDWDGRNQKNLTPELKSINTLSQPKLSPDGKKILFRSFSDKIRLQLLDTKTLQVSTVTEINYRGDIQCSFSPLGDKIVYITKINNLNQIHIIQVDGTEKRNISDPGKEERDPDFSTDGSKIIISSKYRDLYSLTMMNLDGTERINLVQQKEEIRLPSFSPDGQYIAYIAYNKNTPGIYTIRLDGSDLNTVTTRSVVVSKPQITPDASQIVFVTRERGRKHTDIGIINPDGTDFKNLTDGLNIFNQLPHITPNGKSIVFQSVKFNSCDIYRVNVDGSNLINLTNHPKLDQYPSL